MTPIQLLGGHKYSHPQGDMYGVLGAKPPGHCLVSGSWGSGYQLPSQTIYPSAVCHRLPTLSFTQTHENKTTLLSHPCYNKQTGNPPAGPASQDRLRRSCLCQSLSYSDHRARIAMSSSLRKNKGKGGSEQVNHVSYCRSLPSL